jgi:hypothetical protein
MLDACSFGDVANLQRLFIKHGIQPGSKPIPTQVVGPNGPPGKSEKINEPKIPSTDELLERAVAAKQITVVKFILQTYPSLSLNQSHGVVRAVLDNSDPAILQALCGHERDIASFSVDYGMRTFLTDACAQPPAQIVPVLQVLLDNGADVHDG